MSNAVEPPDYLDSATLYSLAGEYFHAAKILAQRPPSEVKVGIVIYYLLGHSGELFLKCILNRNGVPIADLKNKYVHNLAKLIEEAESMSVAQNLRLNALRDLSKVYSVKRLEYRRGPVDGLPDLDDLLKEVKMLSNWAFEEVADYRE